MQAELEEQGNNLADLHNAFSAMVADTKSVSGVMENTKADDATALTLSTMTQADMVCLIRTVIKEEQTSPGKSNRGSTPSKSHNEDRWRQWKFFCHTHGVNLINTVTTIIEVLKQELPENWWDDLILFLSRFQPPENLRKKRSFHNTIILLVVSAFMLFSLGPQKRFMNQLTNDIAYDVQKVVIVGENENTDSIVRKQVNTIFDDEAAAKEEAERMETAIIILSNLIPSHPSLKMLDKTIESMQILKGLHPKTPMFITVDGPAPPRKGPQVIEDEKLARLDAYTEALYKRFSGTEYDHVTIVVNPHHQHINGSVRKVVHSLIDPEKTKYIYVLQHDLRFVWEEKTIDHTALVETFREYSGVKGKEIVRRVMFSQHNNNHYRMKGKCIKEREHFELADPWLIANRTDPDLDTSYIDLKAYPSQGATNITINATATAMATAASITKRTGEVYLSYSRSWSDNNHFTTVDYYKELLNRIGPKPRAPESPMQRTAKSNCTYWGTHLYGSPGDGKYICHLDGREGSVKIYNNCPMEGL